MNPSKRNFLRAATGCSLAAGRLSALQLSTPLAAIAALAAQSSSATAASADYRALVCLFMAGGNDAHNWVVPVDSSGYAEYSRARSGLALPPSALTALTAAPRQAAGRRFAFANELAALKDLYESRELAVLANVGPLLVPTTKASYDAGTNLPPKLFSHNDQTSNWQALAPEGARAGWGGRIADVLMSANGNPVFTTVSAAGNAIFLSGNNATQYQIASSGAIAIQGLYDRYTLSSSSVPGVLRRTMADAGDNPFQAEIARVTKRAADAHAAMSGAMAKVNVARLPSTAQRLSNGASVQLDQSPLAAQLRAVAQLIGAAPALGMKRQVFLVQLGGFDTHANQLRDAPTLMAHVAQSIGYFQGAVRDLGLSRNVTLFTASDFGRTLSSNGSGSDHGWGSHHFIVGGAVKGGDIYGRFPVTALGTTDDVGSGRLLPGTSVIEYAATLARWMGVSATDLPLVLPGLGNFGAGDLGFL